MEEANEVGMAVDSDGGDMEDVAATEPSDDVGRLALIIESVLFAAATPVGVRKLVDILEGPTSKEVQTAVARLKELYAPGQRGIQLLEVAGGYQFRTARENAEWVRAVFRDKPTRLGRAALETLAIIAYKQPVTRAEIEAIRGVDVDGVLSTLLARRLIKIAGRKEAVGRPLLYSTSTEFLETFGLKDIQELPALKELGPAPDDGESSETDATAAAQGDAPQGGTPQECASPESASMDGAAAAAEVAEPARPTAAGADVSDAPLAENSEPGGHRLAAQGGGADPGGARAGEQAGGDGAGDEGESPHRPHHR
jgi:segregation and condensation protein B